MKRNRILVIAAFLLAGFSSKSQYFYKDLLQSRQSRETCKSYRDQKVKEVHIESLDANDEATRDFVCTQTISSDFSEISTFTKSVNTPASTLTAFYDQTGRIIRTVDTSDTYKSSTEYSYDAQGNVSTLVNTSVQTDNHITSVEKHLWTYENGLPKQMIKIKGESDTTMVSLIKDDKGRITEERAKRAGQSLPTIYYYYNADGNLTDIVRYNKKADRLLPDYIFEYNAGKISSMLFVPNGSNDYQRWIYVYEANGLKSKETCYDKKRQVVVRIHYNYSFR